MNKYLENVILATNALIGDAMFKYCKTCGTLVEANQEYCLKHDPKAKLGASTWKPTESKGALDDQPGGNHYKKYPIQPVEYTVINKLSFLQGNVVKYITRYKDKNGIEDLMKVKHYVDLILQLEYGIENPKGIEY